MLLMSFLRSFMYFFLEILPVIDSTFSHNSCQTSPAPPQNLLKYQVIEFLADSKIKKAEPRTKVALKKAPFNVENIDDVASGSLDILLHSEL